MRTARNNELIVTSVIISLRKQFLESSARAVLFSWNEVCKASQTPRNLNRTIGDVTCTFFVKKCTPKWDASLLFSIKASQVWLSSTQCCLQRSRPRIVIDIFQLPARGEPTVAATPWNRRSSPKAFVSFSNPSRSTTSIDLREAKTAAGKTFNIFLGWT